MDLLKSNDFFYLVLPLMIFVLRVVDVSMGTLRIIFVSKGYKKFAPFIGFFEILIWIFAVSHVMENLNSWIGYVAYAGGFATGNFVGMKLEERLAIGHELIRVITKKDAIKLVFSLKDKGFGMTNLKANGIDGEVAVIYIIVKRKKIPEALNIINYHNPNALYTIESIKSVSKEIFHGMPLEQKRFQLKYFFGNK